VNCAATGRCQELVGTGRSASGAAPSLGWHRKRDCARQLAELDAAILGTDATQMEALQEWAGAAEPPGDDASRVITRQR
jgi:hypothetical protein